MFEFLKRKPDVKPKEPAVRAVKDVSADRLAERRRVLRPLPVPEVVEGSNPSDWALWEETVRLQQGVQQGDTVPAMLSVEKEPRSATDTRVPVRGPAETISR